MKKSLAILAILTAGFYGSDANAQYANAPFMTYEPNYATNLDNGNYTASVGYSSSTGYYNTYKLTVTVKNNVVVAINFGNNGYLHNGQNSEGYTYSGGSLRIQTDSNGNIVSASTTVSVRYPNGSSQQFSISLQ